MTIQMEVKTLTVNVANALKFRSIDYRAGEKFI